MTVVALAIARDRKTSYRHLKVAANAKLLPVSRDLPEIVISIDEAAEVLSPTNRDPLTRQVRDNLQEIQRIAGNEAVNVIVSSLRPTSDMIAPQILKQSAVRIALHGLDDADLGHMYGWNRGISAEDLPTKGCAFVGKDTDLIAAKAWFLEPRQIQDAAIMARRERGESIRAIAAGVKVSVGVVHKTLAEARPDAQQGQ
ncbi:hypothetical protein GCM10009678_79060 [Actinomadura kijaniata]|uniref:Uncharacterized protein n=1 Tax=Actinomadura namibiensis TaxID=182080 RepID=A0A7W3QSK7_ACTNM|nr:hypothetical protein [Actinomadura namibiensis]MBA8957508.1 hypothetical protein [Actinomadura namibiensis]